HAVARDKRGSHLALSLERLDALCPSPPQRIGLSATQRPVDLVAKFLVGTKRLNADGSPRCSIINLGHLRKIDLSIEIQPLPMQHVCSMDMWAALYDRLAVLINENRTTLIFVNTRSLCERLAHHLEERLGAEKIGAHHGSLSRAQRLRSEDRLKAGELRALVATSSLELGIDIGSIDLVCQIGITASIGSILQRAGRAGHNLASISRAKLFPQTLDELSTAAALCSAVRRGNMDTLTVPEKPLDILAQQIVAASAAEEWNEDELFEMLKGAYPYRALERKEFDDIVVMLEDGFSTKRGRRSALIHHDAIGKRIRGRRGARLAAITCGGAIPDAADYAIIQEPEGIKVGTLDEHFAVESSPGDIFQLGNTSWRILKVETARVRVEDAKGQPPSLPFWFGEAPARSDELSRELTRQRQEMEKLFETEGLESATRWLMDDSGLARAGAEQIAVYLAETKKTLGALPTLDTLILERFFDESGGMQLILHAPFGRRINWAWGLALRKRFCRGFNFELQAAASENSILLSLGPQHSFPLNDVFNYLRENTVEPLLIQAALEAPVFQTRWRWDACRSLALLRFSSGKKVPPHLMRMRSEDLLCAVFPHANACPETLEGDREVPDHPLVREVLHDCLHEAMDIIGLKSALNGIASGRLKLIARDTVEPSALAGEILAAKVYSFLDDADIGERRTRAVHARRTLSVEDAQGIGALDANAIARVRDECRPDARDADELHDALMTCAYLTPEEIQPYSKLLNT
ncbi:MAG: helicase-related protein, partial [Planctomycetota bacterium]